MIDHGFTPGEWVTDRQDQDEPQMLVVACLETPAEKTILSASSPDDVTTVADYNDGRWPDSPVVKVIYKESADEGLRNRFQIGRASCRERCIVKCRSRWSPYH